MASRLAAEPFWKLIHKSGILPPEDAQSLQRELREQFPGLDSAEEVSAELVAREVLTQWQADRLLGGEHQGFFLGPYRIQGMLGEGGMGTVFLAEHQMMRRLCAIKMLPPKRCQDNPSLVKRFYREAQAAAALDHPNIVRAYDVNKAALEDTEVHYLVMEYVGGMDLQRRVDSQGVLEYRDAAEFIRQASEGLAHAHDRGFVHRDIKPANLLLDPSGTVKILDLGLARFFDPISDASLSGEHGENMLGTADYLAPEQAMNSHGVDIRADIYSLGQTCYFLLTGHAPFPTGTVAERLIAHQMKSPAPIQQERPDAPPGLLEIIEKMIAKKPESRYQSAEEVSAALDEWLKEEADDDREGFASRFHQQFGSARPTNAETTGSISSSAEETDLELAPLDDEESGSKVGGKSKTSDSKPPSATGKSATSDSKVRSTSSGKTASQSGVRRKPAAKSKPEGERAKPDGSRTKTESERAKPEGERAKPGGNKIKATGAKAQGVAGLLDDLTMDEAAGGSNPGTDPLQQTFRPKRKTGLDKAISSPLFWIGTGAATVLLLVIVVLATSTSSSDPEPPPPLTTTPVEAEEDVDTHPTPPEDTVSPKPTASDRRSTSPSRAAERKTPSPKLAVKDEKPSERKPAVVSPKPPEDKKNTQPEKRDPKKPEPVDPKVLFAGVSEFSVEMKSFDRDKESAFHTTVNRILGEAAGRANLKMSKTKAAVMTITLSAPEKDEKVRIMMSAVLKCRDPNNTKSRAVTVWQHEQELGVVSKRLFKTKGVPVRIIRPKVVKFFAQFAKDYQDVRTLAEERRTP